MSTNSILARTVVLGLTVACARTGFGPVESREPDGERGDHASGAGDQTSGDSTRGDPVGGDLTANGSGDGGDPERVQCLAGAAPEVFHFFPGESPLNLVVDRAPAAPQVDFSSLGTVTANQDGFAFAGGGHVMASAGIGTLTANTFVTDQVAVAMWFRVPASSAGVLMAWGESPARTNVRWQVRAGSMGQTFRSRGNDIATEVSTAISADETHLAVARFGGSSSSDFFIDGGLVGSGTHTNSDLGWDGDFSELTIGAEVDGTSRCAATVTSIALYTRTLSDAEITCLYLSGPTPPLL